MPKHSSFIRRPGAPKTPAIHPVWRGIGCIFMVIIPLISFFISNLLIQNDARISWIGIPPEMIMPQFGDPLLLVRIVFTTIISLILFFLVSLITFALNALLNPKKKKPYDVN